MLPPRECIRHYSFLAQSVGQLEVVAGKDLSLANLLFAQLPLLVEVFEVLVVCLDLEQQHALEFSVLLLKTADNSQQFLVVDRVVAFRWVVFP